MKYLTGLFLLIALQGCMLFGGHGMMNHGKTDATQATPANAEPASHQH